MFRFAEAACIIVHHTGKVQNIVFCSITTLNRKLRRHSWEHFFRTDVSSDRQNQLSSNHCNVCSRTRSVTISQLFQQQVESSKLPDVHFEKFSQMRSVDTAIRKSLEVLLCIFRLSLLKKDKPNVKNVSNVESVT